MGALNPPEARRVTWPVRRCCLNIGPAEDLLEHERALLVPPFLGMTGQCAFNLAMKRKTE